jgi:hypothetical protein
MNPLNAYLAQEIISDWHSRAADRRAHPRRRRDERRLEHYDGVTIRRAGPDDRPSLERLAQLEGRAIPPGPALVAEVDCHVLAARWLGQHLTMADPFQPTAELVSLLDARASHLGHGEHAVTRPLRRAVALVRRAAVVRH